MIDYAQEGRDTSASNPAPSSSRRGQKSSAMSQDWKESAEAVATARAQMMGIKEEKDNAGCAASSAAAALPRGNRKEEEEDERSVVMMPSASATAAAAAAVSAHACDPDTTDNSFCPPSFQERGPPPPAPTISTHDSIFCLSLALVLTALGRRSRAQQPGGAQLTNPRAIDDDDNVGGGPSTSATTTTTTTTTAFVVDACSAAAAASPSLWYPYYCRLATFASSVALQLWIKHYYFLLEEHLIMAIVMSLSKQQSEMNDTDPTGVYSPLKLATGEQQSGTSELFDATVCPADGDPTGVYSPLKLASQEQQPCKMVRTVSFVDTTSAMSDGDPTGVYSPLKCASPKQQSLKMVRSASFADSSKLAASFASFLCDNCDKCKPKTRTEGFIRSLLLEKFPSSAHGDALCARVLS